MNGMNSSAKHYDMVVIGSGAAGHHGAIQAANGKKIEVVERPMAKHKPNTTNAAFDSETGDPKTPIVEWIFIGL